jgi:hypothetical protein
LTSNTQIAVMEQGDRLFVPRENIAGFSIYEREATHIYLISRLWVASSKMTFPLEARKSQGKWRYKYEKY